MSNKGLHFYLQGRNSAYTRFYLIYSPDDTFQQFEYKEHDKYLLKNGRDGSFIFMRPSYVFPRPPFANR